MKIISESYISWTFAASPQKSRCPAKLTGQRLCFFRGNMTGNLQADCVQSRQTLFVRYCPWTFAASPQKSRCPVKLTGQRLCFFGGICGIILQLPACPESQTSAVHLRHALPAFRRRSPPAWEYWTHRKTVPVPFVRPHSPCRP